MQSWLEHSPISLIWLIFLQALYSDQWVVFSLWGASAYFIFSVGCIDSVVLFHVSHQPITLFTRRFFSNFINLQGFPDWSHETFMFWLLAALTVSLITKLPCFRHQVPIPYHQIISYHIVYWHHPIDPQSLLHYNHYIHPPPVTVSH